MKLALGTVQFGAAYGAFDGDKKVPEDEVATILDCASENGIKMLDTASAYGEAEKVLGRLGASNMFDIVSKIPKLGDSDQASSSFSKYFEDSLEALGTSRLYGLMMHDCADLLGPMGDILWDRLNELKADGKVLHIGASVYESSQVDALLDRFEISLIQLPFSVFDQRMQTSGALERLKKAGVEVHARSVFLQGFALSDPQNLPEGIRQFGHYLQGFLDIAKSKSVSPLELSTNFAASQSYIDRVVVGVQSLANLKEIISVWNENTDIDGLDDCASQDPDFVNPGLWKLQ